MESPMLLRTLHKTKDLFRKTLKKLKSFLFGEYQKLPKAHFVNPFFSASNSSQKMQELDVFYRDFSERWATNLDELQKGKKKAIVSPKVLVMEDGQCSQTKEQTVKNAKMNIKNEEEKGRKHHEGKCPEICCHIKNGDSRVLAHRMKEFEMFDVDDVDHQLDIEEVLHYYSRLTCPVYVDIVDNFFTDMYSEFASSTFSQC